MPKPVPKTRFQLGISNAGASGGNKSVMLGAFVFSFFLCCHIRGCACLEMLGVSGPSSATEGDTVSLACRYDLGRDAIYSIKWYKDRHELYRYVPTDTSDTKVFTSLGLVVDKDKTRPNLLVFKVTGPLASGEFGCEITVETPSFITLTRTHNLTVIVAPRLAPHISGIDSFYAPGDLVEVACTARDSKPAATLTWSINAKPIPLGYVLPPQKYVNESTGLETSQQAIRFTAELGHFPEGEMRLVCMAEIANVWKTHVEGVALGGVAGGVAGSVSRGVKREDLYAGASAGVSLGSSFGCIFVTGYIIVYALSTLQ